MARGQRRSYDERIQLLNAQIQKEQDKLDALVQEREELLSQKRDSELKELYSLMSDNNLSVDDIILLLTDSKLIHKTA